MARSQGDVKLNIPAGNTYTVQKAGTFIFVKQAQNPVDIIVNGERITMREGDVQKMAMDIAIGERSPFTQFQVENNQSLPVALVLVVGFGDYNRVIVSGNLVSQEGLLLSDGSSVLNDTELQSFWMENLSEVQVIETEGETLPDGPSAYDPIARTQYLSWPIGSDYYYSIKPGVGFDILYQWNRETLEYVGPIEMERKPAPNETQPLITNTVTKMCGGTGGKLYILSGTGNGGSLFRVGTNGRGASQKLFNQDEFTNFESISAITAHLKTGYIIGAWKDAAPQPDISGVCLFHTGSMEVAAKITIPGFPTTTSTMCFSKSRNELLVQSANGYNIYDGDSWAYKGYRMLSTAVGKNGAILDEEKNEFLFGYGVTRIKHNTDKDRHIFGGGGLRNSPYYTLRANDVNQYTAPIEFSSVNNKRRMEGPVLRAIVEMLIGMANIPPNYMDYITRFEYFDGNIHKVIGYGAKTLAALEIEDNFNVQLNEKITLGYRQELLSFV